MCASRCWPSPLSSPCEVSWCPVVWCLWSEATTLDASLYWPWELTSAPLTHNTPHSTLNITLGQHNLKLLPTKTLENISVSKLRSLVIMWQHWFKKYTNKTQQPVESLYLKFRFRFRFTWHHLHWNRNVIILTKFSSMAALDVVILTTSSAANDENFIKMTIFSFQCV